MDFNYVFFQAILHVGAPYIKKWGIFVTLGYTPCWIIMIWPCHEINSGAIYSIIM